MRWSFCHGVGSRCGLARGLVPVVSVCVCVCVCVGGGEGGVCVCIWLSAWTRAYPLGLIASTIFGQNSPSLNFSLKEELVNTLIKAILALCKDCTA